MKTALPGGRAEENVLKPIVQVSDEIRTSNEQNSKATERSKKYEPLCSVVHNIPSL